MLKVLFPVTYGIRKIRKKIYQKPEAQLYCQNGTGIELIVWKLPELVLGK